MLKLIKSFQKKYSQVPSIGFLAGYFKISMERVRQILTIFEKKGEVKFMKKNLNKTSYRLLK